MKEAGKRVPLLRKIFGGTGCRWNSRGAGEQPAGRQRDPEGPGKECWNALARRHAVGGRRRAARGPRRCAAPRSPVSWVFPGSVAHRRLLSRHAHRARHAAHVHTAHAGHAGHDRHARAGAPGPGVCEPIPIGAPTAQLVLGGGQVDRLAIDRHPALRVVDGERTEHERFRLGVPSERRRHLRSHVSVGMCGGGPERRRPHRSGLQRRPHRYTVRRRRQSAITSGVHDKKMRTCVGRASLRPATRAPRARATAERLVPRPRRRHGVRRPQPRAGPGLEAVGPHPRSFSWSRAHTRSKGCESDASGSKNARRT